MHHPSTTSRTDLANILRIKNALYLITNILNYKLKEFIKLVKETYLPSNGTNIASKYIKFDFLFYYFNSVQ